MDDIYLLIFSLLPIKDIYKCMLTNKNFNKIISNELLWKNIYLMNYDDFGVEDEGYFETCKLYHCMGKLHGKNNKFPEKLGELMCLKDIRIRGMINIPTELGLLDNMSEFCFPFGYIKYIPIEITKLKNLTFLQLCYNEISIIPTEIFTMESLVKIDLEYNEITEIPT